MNGIARISAGVAAKIIDFAFSGYGLVCDLVFLKIIFQHYSYRCIRIRNAWMQSSLRAELKVVMLQVENKLNDLMHPHQKDDWYFREVDLPQALTGTTRRNPLP